MNINDTLETNITLPAIAVRALIPLPNNEMKLDVIKMESKLAVKEALASDKLIVLLVQKNFASESLKPSDLDNYAVVAKISSFNDLGPIQKIRVEGIIRCEIIEYVTVDFSPAPKTLSEATI